MIRPRGKRRGAVAILVYNVDNAGGMERQAVLLGERIARLGRRVVLVSTYFPRFMLPEGSKSASPPKKSPPWIERRRDVDLVLYRIPCITTHWWGYPSSQDLYETLAAWILHKHDVDTLYGVQGPTAGTHVSRLAPVLDRPGIVKLACSGSVGDFAEIPRTPRGSRIVHDLRRLDRLVYLNAESRKEAIDAGVAPERLISIPNGIDLARFPRDLAPAELPELGPADGRELVVFVGRLGRQKRVPVLLEAFAKVAARRPRARLAILGDGPERAALEQRARELGLEGRAVFLGVRDDVPRVLRAASAFVLPSAEEGMSNALLEALAAEAPAIATEIPGNRDLVRHEQEGLLVPVDDAPALERAIERLLSDRELARKLARAGRERVESEYAIDVVARRYVALFDTFGERRRVSFLGFLDRYRRSEVKPLVWLAARGLVRTAIPLAQTLVMYAVIAAKKALGIEGDLLKKTNARRS